MHIVFVLGSYYPYYSAVGKCLGNLAEELEKNHQITVVSQLSRLEQNCGEQYYSQHIIRITTPKMLQRLSLESKRHSCSGLAHYLWKLRFFIHRAKNTFQLLFSPESLDRSLVNAYVNGLESIKNPIDLIVPTCNPFDTVVAAMQYKDAHPGVLIRPVLFDKFADSDTLHRNTFNKRLKWERNQNKEREMFRVSDAVLHMPTWTPYIEKYFPEYVPMCIAVEHPLIISQKEPIERTNPNHKTQMVYTGVVDIKNRNPKLAINTICPIMDRYFELHFYSLGSAQFLIDDYANKYRNKIFSHGAVSGENAQKAMRQATFLLSLGNRDFSQVPSKIYEYMSLGKPIIHFAYSNEDPAILYLKKYGNTCCLLYGDDMSANQKKLLCFVQTNHHVIVPYSITIEKFKEYTPAFVSQKLISKLSKKINVIIDK